jgi:hypothetical protein
VLQFGSIEERQTLAQLGRRPERRIARAPASRSTSRRAMTAASVPLKIVMSELMAPRARCNENNAGTSEGSMPLRK